MSRNSHLRQTTHRGNGVGVSIFFRGREREGERHASGRDFRGNPSRLDDSWAERLPSVFLQCTKSGRRQSTGPQTSRVTWPAFSAWYPGDLQKSPRMPTPLAWLLKGASYAERMRPSFRLMSFRWFRTDSSRSVVCSCLLRIPFCARLTNWTVRASRVVVVSELIAVLNAVAFDLLLADLYRH
ncbi:hypothetical protein B0H63DRAFT_218615 [Podospora didyma]|uniref:Uncharacterized protein n=1 Tax=Podospora didyma TaxID=330526 RepID=A0AAE0TWG4_9PEZI|nr:hypothetical protein B0H63DRAFT_218615 [Podospora didyma]